MEENAVTAGIYDVSAASEVTPAEPMQEISSETAYPGYPAVSETMLPITGTEGYSTGSIPISGTDNAITEKNFTAYQTDSVSAVIVTEPIVTENTTITELTTMPEVTEIPVTSAETTVTEMSETEPVSEEKPESAAYSVPAKDAPVKNEKAGSKNPLMIGAIAAAAVIAVIVGFVLGGKGKKSGKEDGTEGICSYLLWKDQWDKGSGSCS